LTIKIVPISTYTHLSAIFILYSIHVYHIEHFHFCVHYLCLIGRLYVFYVGHVDIVVYMKPFSTAIFYHHHIKQPLRQLAICFCTYVYYVHSYIYMYIHTYIHESIYMSTIYIYRSFKSFSFFLAIRWGLEFSTHRGLKSCTP
jgi:hypothetical protein